MRDRQAGPGTQARIHNIAASFFLGMRRSTGVWKRTTKVLQAEKYEKKEAHHPPLEYNAQQKKLVE